jgi:hypothetical protein
MPLSRATMPPSGVTWRTLCRMRCGVNGQRSSVAPVDDPRQDLLAQRHQRGGRLQLAILPVG